MDYPWLSDPVSHLAKSRDVTSETMVEAILELYNPAQLDVLGRAHLAAREQVQLLQEHSHDPTIAPA
nr:hypothetical protein GCM10025699_17570 [Microbacterium flavescens]